MKMPVWLIALDALGTLLLALGILGLTGIDLGLPGITEAAPGLLVVGALLLAPMIVWVFRQARGQGS